MNISRVTSHIQVEYDNLGDDPKDS